MTEDFLAICMGNAARARVLRAFVFNQGDTFTLALAAKRAGVSARIAEKEIRFLKRAELIKRGKFAIDLKSGGRQVLAGKQKVHTWTFNAQFKYAAALSRFVHEISPVRYKRIVDSLKRIGRLSAVILSGSFVGDTSRPADMVVVSNVSDEAKLERAVRALEPYYGREIRYALFTLPEFRYRLTIQDRLIRDTIDYPHLVVFDRVGLF